MSLSLQFGPAIAVGVLITHVSVATGYRGLFNGLAILAANAAIALGGNRDAATKLVIFVGLGAVSFLAVAATAFVFGYGY